MSGYAVFILESGGRFRREFYPINQSGEPSHADAREVEEMLGILVKHQLKMRGIEKYYMFHETGSCYSLPKESKFQES